MARKAKTIIHVNQHVLKANRQNGANEPCLTVKHRDTNTYAHEAIIVDGQGNEVARVVYRPNNPLSCGAVCWIETHNDVKPVAWQDAPTVEPSCPVT